jgi:hypothetical protein
MSFICSPRRRTVAFSSSATVAALAAVVVALAGPGNAAAEPSIASGHPSKAPSGLVPTLRSSKVPPQPLHGQGRQRGRTVARTAALDPSGQVDAVAYCTRDANGAWAFGATHPWTVRPTVTGNQSIAFRFNIYRNNGSLYASTDWWQGEVDASQLFHAWVRGGDYLYYKFMNMRTGELYNSVGYTLYPQRGSGFRETITVYWFVNGSWSRSITFAPAWSTGANPLYYCMG